MNRRTVVVFASACLLVASAVALPGCGKASGQEPARTKPAAEKPKTQAEQDTEKLQAFIDAQFTEGMRQEGDAWYTHLGKVEVVTDGGTKMAICRTTLPERGAREDAGYIGELVLRNEAVAVDSVKVLAGSGQLLLSLDRNSD